MALFNTCLLASNMFWAVCWVLGIPDEGHLASDVRRILHNAMNYLELPGRASQKRRSGE